MIIFLGLHNSSFSLEIKYFWSNEHNIYPYSVG